MIWILIYMFGWGLINISAMIEVEKCGVETSCGYGAVCVNNKSCTCQEGFRYIRKKGDVFYCSDICSEQNRTCPDGSTCRQTNGTWACTCALKYHRSIKGACEDTDECLLGQCPEGSRCINTPGAYKCDCLHGYSRIGANRHTPCKEIDECVRNSTICGKNGNCSNTVGSYACNCYEGFYNDGGNDYPRCIPVTTSVSTPLVHIPNRQTTTDAEDTGSTSLYIGVGVGIACLVIAIGVVAAVLCRQRWRSKKKSKEEGPYLRTEAGRQNMEDNADDTMYQSIVDPIDYYSETIGFENETCTPKLSKATDDNKHAHKDNDAINPYSAYDTIELDGPESVGKMKLGNNGMLLTRPNMRTDDYDSFGTDRNLKNTRNDPDYNTPIETNVSATNNTVRHTNNSDPDYNTTYNTKPYLSNGNPENIQPGVVHVVISGKTTESPVNLDKEQLDKNGVMLARHNKMTDGYDSFSTERNLPKVGIDSEYNTPFNTEYPLKNDDAEKEQGGNGKYPYNAFSTDQNLRNGTNDPDYNTLYGSKSSSDVANPMIIHPGGLNVPSSGMISTNKSDQKGTGDLTRKCINDPDYNTIYNTKPDSTNQNSTNIQHGHAHIPTSGKTVDFQHPEGTADGYSTARIHALLPIHENQPDYDSESKRYSADTIANDDPYSKSVGVDGKLNEGADRPNPSNYHTIGGYNEDDPGKNTPASLAKYSIRENPYSKTNGISRDLPQIPNEITKLEGGEHVGSNVYNERSERSTATAIEELSKGDNHEDDHYNTLYTLTGKPRNNSASTITRI